MFTWLQEYEMKRTSKMSLDFIVSYETVWNGWKNAKLMTDECVWNLFFSDKWPVKLIALHYAIATN